MSSRPRTLTFAGLSVLAIAGTVVVSRRPVKERPELPPARSATAVDDCFAPALIVLLLTSAKEDEEHQSSFFKALSELTHTHRSMLGGYLPSRFINEGYAVSLRGGPACYVVAILRGWDRSTPGEDTQYLLLLDQEGRLLDRLSCSINSRLTRRFVHHKGVFRTDVPASPEPDGAWLVIRYLADDGGSPLGNWSHCITHAGQAHSYSWTKGGWGRGLCRVAVRGGRVVVLFPSSQTGD